MSRIDPDFRYPPEQRLPKAPDRPLQIGLALVVLASAAFAVLCLIKAFHA